MSETQPPATRETATWTPSSWGDGRKLSMEQVRGLCKAHGIVFSGRVTNLDLYHLVCQRFGISTAGVTGERSLPFLSKCMKHTTNFLRSSTLLRVGLSLRCPRFLFLSHSVSDRLSDKQCGQGLRRRQSALLQATSCLRMPAFRRQACAQRGG